MAIWAGIKYAINSTLGTANFKPLNEIILGISAPGGVQIVKSVQRGTHSGGVSDITINISTINPAKSNVAIQMSRIAYNQSNPETNVPYTKELTSTTLKVGASTAGVTQTYMLTPFYWEITEFY